MANEMPHSSQFTGLTRKVIAYSERFAEIIETVKTRALTDADWAPIEQIVDVDTFERQGVFLGAQAETFGWSTYKSYISRYGAGTTWEGTLRRVTETPGLVILELEERNTHGGVMDVSNTVTIYEFDEADKLRHLDVYIMPLEKR
ncbi:hypothetical protein HNO88_002281 [Novosphingobium chloroacetimidivorans]|uniref:SnoaL-like domain-containing protein n=1 Tax=Novosphingobium chloroacetimidivorans TaxID=1428314 RepID=A0A7W7KA10_9SPHN|nr:hypothetical protein [Novosphingobium chloroacetimidivorans]MBB4858955.1 hypothetical protein [Novosphingobium chloroacetimidivorans]